MLGTFLYKGQSLHTSAVTVQYAIDQDQNHTLYNVFVLFCFVFLPYSL